MSDGTGGTDRVESDQTAGGHPEGGRSAHHPVLDGHSEQTEFSDGDGDRASGPTEDESGAGTIIEALGTVGIYLGLCALGLAVIGLLLGMFRIQPIASLTILLSLFLVTISMILGAVFQALGTSGPLLSRWG